MRSIGYWIDWLGDTSHLPPQEVVRPLPDDVRHTVAEYLDGGEVYEEFPDESWCRFLCGHQIEYRELSDGHWVWPADLGHYVRDHGVALPEEFIRHALAGGPRVPKPEWDPSPPDPTFWEDWCLANWSEDYRLRLDAARQRADLQAERLLAAAITELESQEGESDRPCMWAGCNGRALTERALCAICCMRAQDEAERITTSLYFDLKPFLEAYGRSGDTRSLEQVVFDVAEHRRDEDFHVLYDLLQGTEVHVPVEIHSAPAETKWGPRYMKRVRVEVRTQLVPGPDGSACVLALTQSAHATFAGECRSIGWVELLKMALSQEPPAGVLLQGSTSWIAFDAERIRYMLERSEDRPSTQVRDR